MASLFLCNTSKNCTNESHHLMSLSCRIVIFKYWSAAEETETTPEGKQTELSDFGTCEVSWIVFELQKL